MERFYPSNHALDTSAHEPPVGYAFYPDGSMVIWYPAGTDTGPIAQGMANATGRPVFQSAAGTLPSPDPVYPVAPASPPEER
jgi:hypothetical protein